MATRVIITCRGSHHGRVGTLVTSEKTSQYHVVRLEGEPHVRRDGTTTRDLCFRPDEYTRTT